MVSGLIPPCELVPYTTTTTFGIDPYQENENTCEHGITETLVGLGAVEPIHSSETHAFPDNLYRHTFKISTDNVNQTARKMLDFTRERFLQPNNSKVQTPSYEVLIVETATTGSEEVQVLNDTVNPNTMQRSRTTTDINTKPMPLMSHKHLIGFLDDLGIEEHKELFVETWLENDEKWKNETYSPGSTGRKGQIVYPRAKIFSRLIMSFLIWVFHKNKQYEASFKKEGIQQDKIPKDLMTRIIENSVVVCIGAHEYTNELKHIYDFFDCLGTKNGPHVVLLDMDPSFKNTAVEEKYTNRITIVPGKATIQKMKRLAKFLEREKNQWANVFIFSDIRSDTFNDEIETLKYLFVSLASGYHEIANANAEDYQGTESQKKALLSQATHALWEVQQKQLANDSIVERDNYFQMLCSLQGLEMSVKFRDSYDFYGPLMLSEEELKIYHETKSSCPKILQPYAPTNSTETTKLVLHMKEVSPEKAMACTPFHDKRMETLTRNIKEILQQNTFTNETQKNYYMQPLMVSQVTSKGHVVLIPHGDEAFQSSLHDMPSHNIRKIDNFYAYKNRHLDVETMFLSVLQQLVEMQRTKCGLTYSNNVVSGLQCYQDAKKCAEKFSERTKRVNIGLSGAVGKVRYSEARVFIDQVYSAICKQLDENLDTQAGFEKTQTKLQEILPEFKDLQGKWKVGIQELVKIPNYWKRPTSSWKKTVANIESESMYYALLNDPSTIAQQLLKLVELHAQVMFMSIQSKRNYRFENDTLDDYHPHVRNEATLLFTLEMKLLCSLIDEFKGSGTKPKMIDSIATEMAEIMEQIHSDDNLLHKFRGPVTHWQNLYSTDNGVFAWSIVASSFQIINSYNMRAQSDRALDASNSLAHIIYSFVNKISGQWWFKTVEEPYLPMAITKYHRGLSLSGANTISDEKITKYYNNRTVTIELYFWVMRNLVTQTMSWEVFLKNYDNYFIMLGKGPRRFKTFHDNSSQNVFTWPGALPTAHVLMHARDANNRPNVFIGLLQETKKNVSTSNFSFFMSVQDNKRINMLRRAVYYGYVQVVEFLLGQYDEWNLFSATYEDNAPLPEGELNLRGSDGYFTIMDDALLNEARCKGQNDKTLSLKLPYPHQQVSVQSHEGHYTHIVKLLTNYTERMQQKMIPNIEENMHEGTPTWLLLSGGPILKDQRGNFQIDKRIYYSITPALVSTEIMKIIISQTTSLRGERRILDACGGVGGDLSLMLCSDFQKIICTEINPARCKMIQNNVKLVMASCMYVKENNLKVECTNYLYMLWQQDTMESVSNNKCNILFIDPPWENYENGEEEFTFDMWKTGKKNEFESKTLSQICHKAFNIGYRYVFLKLPRGSHVDSQLEILKINFKVGENKQFPFKKMKIITVEPA